MRKRNKEQYFQDKYGGPSEGKRKGGIINRDILKLSIFLVIIFFSLIFYLCYFVGAKAPTVINNTYNRRTSVLEESVVRGSVYSRDGELLAYTETEEDGTEKRVYPYGQTFAHVIGFTENGMLGLESSYNYYLLTSNANIFQKIYNDFTDAKDPGDSLITTLDVSLQEAACNALGDNYGAVLAMDPATGEILAMVSYPTFDPNTIADAWESITSDEGSSVLVNRVTQGTYTPGSTFKIFTLLEYYREAGSGVYEFNYDCTGSVSVDDTVINCVSVHGFEDIIASFANSCNGAFITIGEGLDKDKWAENNKNLLFNSELPIDIAYNESSFTLNSASSEFLTAQTSFGQGETLISPLHISLITSAIANGGTLMKPHLVSRIVNSSGNTTVNFESSQYASLLSGKEAEFMKNCMRSVVTDGTASSLNTDLYTAYGKTGTAQTTDNEDEQSDHSWFTGFAEKDGQTIVVCAMIEDAQGSGLSGQYLAKQIFDCYFSDR